MKKKIQQHTKLEKRTFESFFLLAWKYVDISLWFSLVVVFLDLVLTKQNSHALLETALNKHGILAWNCIKVSKMCVFWQCSFNKYVMGTHDAYLFTSTSLIYLFRPTISAQVPNLKLVSFINQVQIGCFLLFPLLPLN